MAAQRVVSDLENGIRRIPGVRQAKVVGDPHPEEIHVVAGSERSPKQIVRDIQSLAQAAFRTPIDHRIVSIVQVEDEVTLESAGDPAAEISLNGAAAETLPGGGRWQRSVLLDGVVVTTRGTSSFVEVTLLWPDGSSTQGSGSSGGVREARARAAVSATVRALEPVLQRNSAWMEIDQVVISRLLDADVVLVKATYSEGRADTSPLVGAAIIRDDAATAAARALLDAVARRLPSP